MNLNIEIEKSEQTLEKSEQTVFAQIFLSHYYGLQHKTGPGRNLSFSTQYDKLPKKNHFFLQLTA